MQSGAATSAVCLTDDDGDDCDRRRLLLRATQGDRSLGDLARRCDPQKTPTRRDASLMRATHARERSLTTATVDTSTINIIFSIVGAGLYRAPLPLKTAERI